MAFSKMAVGAVVLSAFVCAFSEIVLLFWHETSIIHMVKNVVKPKKVHRISKIKDGKA
jgi:hypothetical protein